MCRILAVLYWFWAVRFIGKLSESFKYNTQTGYRDFSLNIFSYRQLFRGGIQRRPSSLRSAKIQFVKDLKEQLKDCHGIFQFKVYRFTHPVRFHIKENLIKNFEPSESGEYPFKMRMVKNSLMRIAVTGTQFEPLIPKVEKTNLYIFVFDDSIVPKMMSVLNGLRKSSAVIRSCFDPSFACYSGIVAPSLEMRSLSSLPPKPELCKRIPPVFRLPMHRLVDSVSLPSRLLNSLTQVFYRLNSALGQIK